MNLGKHIEELLHSYNCVIIPEFGGFVASDVPAQLNISKNIIEAPYKQIIFNKNLVQNDGLLANKMANANAENYEQSLSKIREFVIATKARLNNKERVEIQNVGFLYQDTESNIQFTQSKEHNFLAAAFGLPSIKLTPLANDVKRVSAEPKEIKKETKIVPLVSVKEKGEEKTIVGPLKKKNWKKHAVVAACMLPIAFYSYWIPSQTNAIQRGGISLSDFNPFHKVEKSNYNPRAEKIDFATKIESSNINLEEFITESKTVFADLKEVKVETTYVAFGPKFKVENHNNSTNKYHIIAGCFKKIENANSFVTKLKDNGYNAFIIDKRKGLNRVVIESFSSRGEAKKILKQLKSEGQSGWILKK